MKSNRWWMASGVLAAFTAVLHAVAGTLEIQRPLLESSMPQSISLLLYACWHLVTVTLVLSAAALIWSARTHAITLVGALPGFVSWLWILFGLVFVAVALLLAGPSGLAMLPQWVLLIPVGVLGLLGGRKRRLD
jgi:hypothetical protein